MEKAGIDGSAAQADKEISAADRKGTEGEAEYKNANKRHGLPQSYHVFIGNLHGKETADKTAEGDPEIKTMRSIVRPFLRVFLWRAQNSCFPHSPAEASRAQ